MDSSPVALIVSADRHLRRLVAASLDQIGCMALDVAASRQGLDCVGTTHVDFIIVDVSLTDALEEVLVQRLRLEQPDLKVLYLINRAQQMSGCAILARRVDAYLRRPFRLHELRALVSSWLLDDGYVPAQPAGMSLN